MKKIPVNALVDLFALITFIPSLISGLVLFKILPEGSGRASLYLGITRSQWISMHDFTSIIFAALVIIHILLHGKFFRNVGKCLVVKDKSCGVNKE